MTRTLLSITEDFLLLDELIAEQEGDITGCESAVDAILADLRDDLRGKVDNYIALTQEQLARASVRRAEADRLDAMAKCDEESASWLKAKLKAAFETLGIAKLDTDRFKVSIAKNGGAIPVIITDESAIPQSWMRVVTSPDKDRIREALAAGREVAGAALGERGTRLAVR